MTGVITWTFDCGDGVCIEREQPSTALKPMTHFTTFDSFSSPDVYHPEFQPELNDFEIPHGPHFHGHDPVTGCGPNGFSEVEIHFATPLQENCANGTFLQENCANGTFLQENCANGTFLHEGQQGFSEVEVHFEYNLGGTAGPGGTSFFTENIGGSAGPSGTSFLTGYTNGTICEGMDSTTEVIDVMNHFTNFAMPVGDFI